MAFVAAGAGTGYFLTVQMIDRNEDPTSKEYELDVADYAEALGAALEVIGDLPLVSDCEIVGYHVGQRFVENAIVVPTVGEAQTKARLIIRLAGGNKKATIDIPAPKETIFMALTGKANKVVNVTNTDVLDFLQNFEAAGTAFISDGEKMAAAGLLEGRKVSVASGFRR
jgi:hypothetical protein